MSARATFKAAVLATAALWAMPFAASAQTSGASKSERGMPDSKAEPTGAKSERAMPSQTEDSGTPPASAERAMPSPDKK